MLVVQLLWIFSLLSAWCITIREFLFLEANKDAPVDVKGLLAKLQKSGILSSLKAGAVTSARKEETGGDSPNRAATPPIPSEHRGEVTDRLPKPPSDFKNFSMRALKM